MIDVRDVRKVAGERALDVCRFLLPAGCEESGRWVVGDWNGVVGRSLTVELSGPEAGNWRDWKPNDEGGETGDLIGLWMHRRKVDFRQALREMWAEFGKKEVGAGWEKSRDPERMKGGWVLGEVEALGLRELLDGEGVWKWMREKHKIDLRRAPLGVMERESKEHGVEVVFEYRNELGELAFVKCMDEDGKMRLWPERPARWVLFGTDSMEYGATELILVRTELDVLAMRMFGIKAAAMPRVTYGGDEWRWLDDQAEWLGGMQRIVFAFGMKDEERAHWEKLAARIGEERVFRAMLPDGHSSAHECLVHGVGAEGMQGAVGNATRLEPLRLVRPADVWDRVLDLYFPDDRKVEQGDPLPYRFPAEFRFRPGELTVWQGYTGSGKTQVLNNCLVYWAREWKRRYCVASLEVDAADTFWYQARIWSGRRKPETEAESNRQRDWLHEWGSAYYHVGAAALEDIFRIFEYEARRRGAWHFVLDSLMRVAGVRSDDYDGQKEVCDQCIEFARRYRVHVHLVCHSKKPDARHPVEKCWPSKYDISGSAALANLPHNIVCVWRNKGKEDALNEADLMPEGLEREECLAQWKGREDTLLIVQKNRKTGGEGEKRLWFDGANCRFREDPSSREDALRRDDPRSAAGRRAEDGGRGTEGDLPQRTQRAQRTEDGDGLGEVEA